MKLGFAKLTDTPSLAPPLHDPLIPQQSTTSASSSTRYVSAKQTDGPHSSGQSVTAVSGAGWSIRSFSPPAWRCGTIADFLCFSVSHRSSRTSIHALDSGSPTHSQPLFDHFRMLAYAKRCFAALFLHPNFRLDPNSTRVVTRFLSQRPARTLPRLSRMLDTPRMPVRSLVPCLLVKSRVA